MMRQAPVSLEALKLKLISGGNPAGADPLLTRDGIRYLLKALMYADAAFATEIENVLVKVGALAVPDLIKNLSTDHVTVRATSAMALIRMGVDAEDALLKAYPKIARKPNVRWVYDFVFQELNLPVPAIVETDQTIQTLERVS